MNDSSLPFIDNDSDHRPVFRQPTRHCQTRRMRDHDYKKKCAYLWTFMRSRELSALSVIRGDIRVRGDRIYTEPTTLGIVFLDALTNFLERNPLIKCNYKVVMPDHVHIIFYVTDKLDRKFGWYVGQLKASCTRIMRERFPQYAEKDLSYFIRNGDNDRILYDQGQWSRWQRYIEDNPRRALLRSTFTDLFQRTLIISDGLGSLHAYGNLFLLHYPEKIVVRYTSKVSEAENNRRLQYAREIARNGGVLVSPFIHPIEDEIYKEGLKNGWRMIRIIEFGLPARKHPYREEFDYCATGNYLLVSLRDERSFERRHPTRAVCLEMNRLAERIVESDFSSAKFRRE